MTDCCYRLLVMKEVSCHGLQLVALQVLPHSAFGMTSWQQVCIVLTGIKTPPGHRMLKGWE